MASTTNRMKARLSLVSDVKAFEDAAMVLDNHLEKIKEQHSLLLQSRVHRQTPPIR